MNTAVDKICETCRYWSELVVRSCGPKPSLEALCLNREGPFYSLFCRGARCCPSWASGHLGEIDYPDLPEGAYANHSSRQGRARTNSINPPDAPIALQYVKQGVEDLVQEKLGKLLELKIRVELEGICCISSPSGGLRTVQVAQRCREELATNAATRQGDASVPVPPRVHAHRIYGSR